MMNTLENCFFKYFTEPHFLENGLFRFTQPAALNDPLEAFPRLKFGDLSEEDFEIARQKAKDFGYDNPSEEVLRDLFLTPFASHRFDEKAAPGLWPHTEPRLRAKPFRTIDEIDMAFAERAVELLLDMANREFGIFSLSENYNNSLWAHYGNDHKGAAIAFDREHPSFKEVTFPITYSDRPIFVSSYYGVVRICGHQIQHEEILSSSLKGFPLRLLFLKKLEWQWEKEWRQIRYLSKPQVSTAKDEQGHPIHLFPLPASSVKAIILGSRSSSHLQEKVINFKTGRPMWRNVPIYRRRMTPRGDFFEEEIA